jgi:Bifunctional DNA primase/polymerase, N-terminal
MSAPGTPIDAALAWAAQGVAVLPVRPGEKAPLTRSGLHDATIEARVLRRWWSRWPAANVAIATGAPGVDVLDVDVRGSQSGWAALRRLREAGVVPAVAPLVRTPSGGVHLYFIGTDQRNGSLPDEHLDFRSAGGYVLVPPSTVNTETYSGTYRWGRRTAPTARLDWQVATNLLRPIRPEPVDSSLRRPVHRNGDVHTLAAAVAREREGNRNRLLFWAFCEAMRSGYDPRRIADAGLRCGQTVREVEATWRQAVKRISADGQAPPSPAVSVWHQPARTAAVVHTF